MQRQVASFSQKIRQKIQQGFLRNEFGATAIEYSIIAAGIALVIVAVVNGVGTQVNTMFTSVQTAVK